MGILSSLFFGSSGWGENRIGRVPRLPRGLIDRLHSMDARPVLFGSAALHLYQQLNDLEHPPNWTPEDLDIAVRIETRYYGSKVIWKLIEDYERAAKSVGGGAGGTLVSLRINERILALYPDLMPLQVTPEIEHITKRMIPELEKEEDRLIPLAALQSTRVERQAVQERLALCRKAKIDYAAFKKLCATDSLLSGAKDPVDPFKYDCSCKSYDELGPSVVFVMTLTYPSTNLPVQLVGIEMPGKTPGGLEPVLLQICDQPASIQGRFLHGKEDVEFLMLKRTRDIFWERCANENEVHPTRRGMWEKRGWVFA